MQKARQQGRLKRRVCLTGEAYQETISPPTRPLPADFDYDNYMLRCSVINRCYAHALADPACDEVNKYIVEPYLKWTQGKDRPYKGTIMVGEYYNISKFKIFKFFANCFYFVCGKTNDESFVAIYI